MQKFKTIISMMSGTSIDGIDACLVKIFDNLSFEVIDNYSLDYPQEIREKLFELANNKGDVKDVCFMNFVVGEQFAKCANELIKKANIKKEEIDFISSHGQTICHLPQKNTISDVSIGSTLQIGDISVISDRTGIMTIGDFRPKDISANGEGAPLIPFADKILFGLDKNRLIQNIGGISNVTVLSNDCDIFAFDNGVGNMLIDYFTNKLFNMPFDKDGEIASKGYIDETWLNELLKEPYYSIKPPKSTGRELFNNEYAEKIYKSAPKNKYDVIATLTALTAKVITNSYKEFILPKTKIDEIVIGGGGAFNKTLLKFIQNYIGDIPVKTHQDFNIPDKLKEAIGFAYLGYFTYIKKANNVPSCTGANKEVVMGKISY